MKYLKNAKELEELKTGIYLLDFYADWCGPCKMLSPILEEIKNAEVIKINVDEFPELANKYGVMSIPKLVYIKDGIIKKEQVGLQTEEVINETIKELK